MLRQAAGSEMDTHRRTQDPLCGFFFFSTPDFECVRIQLYFQPEEFVNYSPRPGGALRASFSSR